MLVKARQTFISQKSNRIVRVERVVQRFNSPRFDEVEIADITNKGGKWTRIPGTLRVVKADSLRRNYLSIV